MKRTRVTTKVQNAVEQSCSEKAGNAVEDDSNTKPENAVEHKIVQRKNFRNQSTNMNNLSKSTQHQINEPVKNIENDVPEIPKSKLNLKSLRDRNQKIKNTVVSSTSNFKKKPRAVVDLNMMKEELKQLEDPPSTSWEKEISSNRLPYSFFDSPCEELAQNLLGKILVRHLENGTILKGRIVETESYLGTVDKASHSYQSKVTPRNIPMYMPPGTIYVYMTYGMYHCFNISSQGEGCAVLIRALDPLEGIEHMANERNLKGKSSAPKKALKVLKPHELCSGPSKLCMAFQLEKCHSRYSMCTWKGLWLEDDTSLEEIKIIKCSRVGIDSCGPEWASKPLRYYIHGNKSVSKRDKKAEALLDIN